ncbi:cupin domain-containing protein [Maritalea sp. S77]|uniref:cupin domain-containing protein n=1 Tax=Maritalea sp. S77 TaxID=3415125 RepID=UPI003C7C6C29
MTAPLSDQEIAIGQTNDQIGTTLVSSIDGMHIWHLRLSPGETLPAHRHARPYFWTVLTDGTAQSRFDDGRVVNLAYTSSQTRHFPDLSKDNSFVHDLTNTGETELVFVTVEFTN